jgi:PncC family amidohydrolase
MARPVAAELVRRAQAAGLTLAAAESCTAGLVADLLARVPGASRVFWGSLVTYTGAAKVRMLGLKEDQLARFGAVSPETARAMAEGALEQSGADLAVSVTGIAGPGGDGTAVPVGTVWIGLARNGGESRARVFHYQGPRNEVRRRAARDALEVLLEGISLDDPKNGGLKAP